MIFQRLREINLIINSKRKICVNQSKKLNNDLEKLGSKNVIDKTKKTVCKKKSKKGWQKSE